MTESCWLNLIPCSLRRHKWEESVSQHGAQYYCRSEFNAYKTGAEANASWYYDHQRQIAVHISPDFQLLLLLWQLADICPIQESHVGLRPGQEESSSFGSFHNNQSRPEFSFARWCSLVAMQYSLICDCSPIWIAPISDACLYYQLWPISLLFGWSLLS